MLFTHEEEVKEKELDNLMYSLNFNVTLSKT